MRLAFPDTLDEACDVLREEDGRARPVAGGTALQMRRRRGRFEASTLVDLGRIPGLDRIELTDDGLRIGALVTHRRMETDPVVAALAPLLRDAYATIANVRVRHVATVGGNLAYADHRLDPPGALLLLGATVEIVSPGGLRIMPLAAFHTGLNTTALLPGDVLVAVRVSRAAAGSRARFAKFKSLGRNDWPCVGVAALLAPDSSGGRRLELGLTAVSPVPVHVSLDVTGAGPSEAAERAQAAIEPAIDPIADLRGGVRFKRRAARATVADTVRALCEEGQG
jgi:carbon-monoxide dehydrogenase medium subunit